jgi:hypothetical protein
MSIYLDRAAAMLIINILQNTNFNKFTHASSQLFIVTWNLQSHIQWSYSHLTQSHGGRDGTVDKVNY